MNWKLSIDGAPAPREHLCSFGPEVAAAMAAAAPYATMAGAAISAVGALSAGESQSKMMQYNAAVAEREAEAARQQAKLDEDRHRQQGDKLLSRQRAATAGSGVEAEGSPLLVMSDSAAEIERDAQLIRYGGEIKAGRAQSQAAMDRMNARAAKTSSYFAAGGSLLSGAGAAGRSLLSAK